MKKEEYKEKSDKHLLFKNVWSFPMLMEDKIIEINLIRNKVNGLILPDLKKIRKTRKNA